MSRFLTSKKWDKIMAWLDKLPEPIQPPNIPPGPPPGPQHEGRPKLPGNDVLEDIEIALTYLDNSRWHLLHLRANILEKIRWQQAERECANIRGKELTAEGAKYKSSAAEQPTMASQDAPTFGTPSSVRTPRDLDVGK